RAGAGGEREDAPAVSSINREENEKADVTTKFALDNEPDEIVRKATRNHEDDVVGYQQHDALRRIGILPLYLLIHQELAAGNSPRAALSEAAGRNTARGRMA